jgi:hypothetical protein
MIFLAVFVVFLFIAYMGMGVIEIAFKIFWHLFKMALFVAIFLLGLLIITIFALFSKNFSDAWGEGFNQINEMIKEINKK